MYKYYSVEGAIGKGQFGLVKLGTHKASDVKVAVKVMTKANMKIIEAH